MKKQACTKDKNLATLATVSDRGTSKAVRSLKANLYDVDELEGVQLVQRESMTDDSLTGLLN